MKIEQTDKAVTLDCGCNIHIEFSLVEPIFIRGSLNQCPLHKAALQLLEALEKIARMPWPESEAPYARMARAAIELAKK